MKWKGGIAKGNFSDLYVDELSGLILVVSELTNKTKLRTLWR